MFVNKHFTNFTSILYCEIFRVLILYEHEHIGRYSNLYQSTCKMRSLSLQFRQLKPRYLTLVKRTLIDIFKDDEQLV